MYRRKSINPNRTLGRKKAEKSVKLGQIYKESKFSILHDCIMNCMLAAMTPASLKFSQFSH